MNADEIRKWGIEVEKCDPLRLSSADKAFPSGQDRKQFLSNFSLETIHIRATLEVAAQIAELKEIMRDVTKNL